MAKRTSEAERRILREAVRSSVPGVPAQFDDVERQFVYVPPSHMRALDPDAMLVVGIRGAGKSFWWHALLNQQLRESISSSRQLRDLQVSPGFGSSANAAWPGKDELTWLLKKGHKPRFIWKAVVLRQIAKDRVPSGGWNELLPWVESEPFQVAEILREGDEKLTETKRRHLVLFDALDQTADEWQERQALLRGLLELVLELRSFRSIRAKAFVRPDMLNDPAVQAFPDASKLLASRVALNWTTVDLYGLLFKYLGNAKDTNAATAFRNLSAQQWAEGAESGWDVPSALTTDAERQVRVFTALAGPWMGKDRRRGKSYTWIPNHLSDAFDNVSPRSFLAALRQAAELPEVQGQEYPLHFSGLQDGVRAASKYRVQEVAEDLPWAHEAMEMLADTVVPCPQKTLRTVWEKGRLLEKLSKEKRRALPEVELDGILAGLRGVGILKELASGRINIPDVYRVGFGLRRMGGFRPD